MTTRKIAHSAIVALRGTTGAEGSPGPVGPPGATGPGASSFDATVPQDGKRDTLITIEGIQVKSLCSPTQVSLDLATVTNMGTMDASGTATITPATVQPIDQTATNEFGVVATAGAPWEVNLDVIARNTDVSKAFMRLDLHAAAPTCKAWGMITPSASR